MKLRRAAIIVLVIGLSAGACSGSSAPATAPPNPLVGLITAIEGNTIVVATDAASWRFVIGDGSVPIEHLRTHMDDRLPVSITSEAGGGGWIATAIADA